METTEVFDGVRAHALLHASIDYESYTLTIDPRQLCGVLLILLTFQIKSLGLVRYLKCASTASQTSTELISMVIKSSECCIVMLQRDILQMKTGIHTHVYQ